MSDQFGYESFLSPFSWRYGSDAMRILWSEAYKRRLWRRLWVALAEAQREAGLVSAIQVADLRAHQDAIDVEAANQIERSIQHDLMAEIAVYAGQCSIGGGIIHLGATSMDIEDNADALRLREALTLICEKLRTLLASFADKIDAWADKPSVGYTHLQPAEPTTVGYRLAQYSQDLLIDWQELTRVTANVRGKGIKGAVGTAASYGQLLKGTPLSAAELEQRVMTAIGLPAFTVTGQTYPRKQDLLIANALSVLASSLYKFAFDLRILQSPAIGEWAEPFGKHQIGSSAMPFKRNPINAEKIDSLGRLVASFVHVAWDNASQSLLERTLDDSANRREMLPVLFLAIDEMLSVALRLIDGLQIDERAIARNLQKYGTFAATERLLMELVKAGADRQHMHELLRTYSLSAWAAIADGTPNPLIDDLCADATLMRYLSSGKIRSLLDASQYIGDAPQRARALAVQIRETTALPDQVLTQNSGVQK